MARVPLLGGGGRAGPPSSKAPVEGMDHAEHGTIGVWKIAFAALAVIGRRRPGVMNNRRWLRELRLEIWKLGPPGRRQRMTQSSIRGICISWAGQM